MGLIQREIEKQGIPTISVSLSEVITKQVRPPRAVDFGFPLGHPFGFPNQKFLQRRLINLLLEKLKEIKTPGTFEKIPICRDDRGDCPVCRDPE